MSKKTFLMILDGWGCGKSDQSDVVTMANTPNMDQLSRDYPTSRLMASGENVGLPEGQMGNSEVGHLNIGAGRVVYQDLVKITKDAETGELAEKPVLAEALQYAKDNNKAVHFLGLLSDGGVHSMNTHLYHLCDITKNYGLDQVYIHALTDGRDTDPYSGLEYVRELQKHLSHSNGRIASLIGRYYTMDRDKRWERIKLGYDLLVKGAGEPTRDLEEKIQRSYDEGVTDEFIKPLVMVDEDNQPIGTIQEGDVVICFNFRTDRLRQITTALTQQDFPEHDMRTLPLYYCTMTRYDDSFKGVKVIYDKDNVPESMGEVVAKNGLKQVRIAETEKYAHVTFFFSGGREKEFDNESRLLIPSPKVATYDLQPEMSAYQVKDTIIKGLDEIDPDFVCLNFANGDMVGHTGVYDAIKKALEVVDECVGEVVKVARDKGFHVMIIADHGNADFAINQDGSPNTAHTTNPVPCILVSDDYKSLKDGILADVAPTLLSIMGLEVPDAMTGKVLVD